MMQDKPTVLSAGPATFALLACGCHAFYIGHDIAPGKPVICPSPTRCANTGSRWTTVTSTLAGTVQPAKSRSAA